MRRIERSLVRPVLALLAGAVVGFVLPHIRPALAQDASPAVAIGDDEKKPDDKDKDKDKDKDVVEKGRCSCNQFACTNSDGMRNVNAACGVKNCPEGKVPVCECGKCTEDGQFESRNKCQCKAE